MKDRKKSYERQANIAVGLLIFIICGIPILLMLALYWLLSDARSMGMMGFIQAIVYRLLGIMTAIVVVIGIKKTVQNKSSAVKRMAMAAGIVLCIAVSALLMRPIVLDIPYLSHPETMYLSDLEFEADTNYEYGQFYKLYGVDAAGKMHSFDTSEKRMEEGQELVQASDRPVYAKVTCLPHTKTLMTLKYTTMPDASATEFSLSFSELPKNSNVADPPLSLPTYTGELLCDDIPAPMTVDV